MGTTSEKRPYAFVDYGRGEGCYFFQKGQREVVTPDNPTVIVTVPQSVPVFFAQKKKKKQILHKGKTARDRVNPNKGDNAAKRALDNKLHRYNTHKINFPTD